MRSEPPPDSTRATVTQAEPVDMPFIGRQLNRLKLDHENLDCKQFLVARQGRKIVGFGRIKAEEGFYEMASLAVLEAHRGQGIGIEIARKLLDFCPDHTIYLVTDIPGFFEKLGFKITDEVPTRLAKKIKEFCSQPPYERVVAMVLQR